ncbi:Trk system potassium uptake protein TrkG [Roseovarius albus]|uniref:Trk system potassium uptake protein TrkG n=1 Tax=Roseovarius albus TaxID=1247867 RepID=A0A1X6Z177_9RHOB|nr:potassium transporter TrkG [Roseovarius albus]SLN36977.1 Trk system potassium uptake protein TrkG [Roseovarius albus]
MMKRLLRYPLFLILSGLSALAMLVPAAHALYQDDHSMARAFFYSSVLGLILVFVIGLTLSAAPKRRDRDLQNLWALFMAYTVLPLYLALPFYEGLQTTSYFNAYFEMVSSFTTTGATLFDVPGRLEYSLHLWRGLVGWLGGLLIWVSASAVLAPLNLGGFEVTATAEPGQSGARTTQFQRADTARRIFESTRLLAPFYIGLTIALWLFLTISGEIPFDALMHAMATLSTSGISAIEGMAQTGSGFAGEVLIFLFMMFALSRLTFSSDTITSARPGLHNDPEFRVGLLVVILLPIILVIRHWIGAAEVSEETNLGLMLQTLWGGVFTSLSFLSTTGFESSYWDAARDWSGLGTPGMILMGLALIGGGVATTAGGVKLLRVYALYLHCQREMERLIHPSSVGRSQTIGRRIRRQGAFIAWLFFMLFALSLAVITVILALLGQDFEQSLVLAISALSTTGPLTQVAGEQAIDLLQMSPISKLVMCVAMVIGRLETLAIIALCNPTFWRD